MLIFHYQFWKKNIFYNQWQKMMRKIKAQLNVELINFPEQFGLLLEGERSVVQVAMETGYSSEAHFIKAFREHWGITPGQLRKQNGVSVISDQTGQSGGSWIWMIQKSVLRADFCFCWAADKYWSKNEKIAIFFIKRFTFWSLCAILSAHYGNSVKINKFWRQGAVK